MPEKQPSTKDHVLSAILINSIVAGLLTILTGAHIWKTFLVLPVLAAVVATVFGCATLAGHIHKRIFPCRAHQWHRCVCLRCKEKQAHDHVWSRYACTLCDEKLDHQHRWNTVVETTRSHASGDPSTSTDWAYLGQVIVTTITSRQCELCSLTEELSQCSEVEYTDVYGHSSS